MKWLHNDFFKALIVNDPLIATGILFHSRVMKSIGDNCFRVRRLNLLCFICRALTLQCSIRLLIALGSLLWMNFQPYTHAWVLKMSSTFMICILLNARSAGALYSTFASILMAFCCIAAICLMQDGGAVPSNIPA